MDLYIIYLYEYECTTVLIFRVTQQYKNNYRFIVITFYKVLYSSKQCNPTKKTIPESINLLFNKKTSSEQKAFKPLYSHN